jgi:hypothetical protein
MLGVAASVHQCRSVGIPVHDSRGSKVGVVHPYLPLLLLFFHLNQQTLSWSERVASWWHSLWPDALMTIGGAVSGLFTWPSP